MGDELDCSKIEMGVAEPQGTLLMGRNGWILEVCRKKKRRELVDNVGNKGKEVIFQFGG